jgi:PhnB protein
MASQPKPTTNYMPPGFHTITPYIIVPRASEFIDFLKRAFAATERLRVPMPDGLLMHAEVAVGDSMIELADANEKVPPAPAAIHLYVSDADATYANAIAAGAASLYEPADQPWGDRQGAARDPFGNIWYIATNKSWTPGPGELRTVQVYLHLHGADKMIPFLQNAFGAEALGVAKSPEGTVLHATIKIGDNTLEIDEAHGEFQPMPCHLHLYVPNADAQYDRALRAGATSIEPPTDKPYGERSACVKDPWCNTWYVATSFGNSTP